VAAVPGTNRYLGIQYRPTNNNNNTYIIPRVTRTLQSTQTELMKGTLDASEMLVLSCCVCGGLPVDAAGNFARVDSHKITRRPTDTILLHFSIWETDFH
jgi:hypothetical protein